VSGPNRATQQIDRIGESLEESCHALALLPSDEEVRQRSAEQRRTDRDQWEIGKEHPRGAKSDRGADRQDHERPEMPPEIRLIEQDLEVVDAR
jgi:hypothetical protein